MISLFRMNLTPSNAQDYPIAESLSSGVPEGSVSRSVEIRMGVEAC